MLKVLIVDDEELIREGLKKIISRETKEYSVCGTAENGEVAKEMIAKLKPNIVISDVKMPKLDGIELITWMNRYYPRIKHIILSGYNDAQLIIACLRLKTNDYLLKPIDKFELFRILDKLSEDINNESMEITKNTLLHETFNLARDKTLIQLTMQGTIDRGKSKDILKKYEIKFDDSLYRVLVISADITNEINIEQPMKNDSELLGYAIRNISEEILEISSVVNFSFVLPTKEVVIFVEMYEESKDDEIIFVAESIKDTILRAINHSVTIGLSNIYSGLEQANIAYGKAIDALSYRLIGGGNGIWLEKSGGAVHGNIDVFIDMSRKLVSNIELSNEKKALQIINEICSAFFDNQLCPQGIYDIVSDIIIRTKIMIKEQKFNFDIEKIEILDKDIKRFENIQEIKSYLTDMANAVIGLLEEQRGDSDMKLVFLAKQYIETNYFNDITLNSVADYLHISKNYFCEIFKKGSGRNFIDFLTDVRVENAKKLLKETDLYDYDVSLMIGYNNPTYFSKVFKKATGITTTQYRKLN